jgi:hypothetical protein
MRQFVPVFVTIDTASLLWFCRAVPVYGKCSRYSSVSASYFSENDQNGSVPGFRLWDSRVACFPGENKNVESEITQEFADPKSPAEIKKLEDPQMLDRVANEATEQAGTTERLYGQSHDIFRS